MEAVHESLIADRAPPQIGLVVGKLEVGARDFVLALVPFPDWTDDASGEGSGSSTVGGANGTGKSVPPRPASSGAPLEIDPDWILEHTTHVSRMLPGGLTVVGAYAFASDAAFKTAMPAFSRAVVEASEEVSLDERSRDDDRDPERSSLLIHLSADDSKRRVTRRTRRSTLTQPPQPVETRSGRALENVVSLSATYRVNLELRARGIDGEKTRALMEKVVELEIQRVLASDVLIEDALWDDDTVISSVPRRNARRSEGSPDDGEADGDGFDWTHSEIDVDSHAVFALRAELVTGPGCVVVMPPRNDAFPGAGPAEPTTPRTIRIAGAVASRSYAFSRETVRRAADDLRRDVARSIRSRLDVLLDEADARDEDEDEDEDAAREKEIGARLPRRAFATWIGGLRACDYLSEGETALDVVARCAEVLRWRVPDGVEGVVVAEREPDRVPTQRGPALSSPRLVGGGAAEAAVLEKATGTGNRSSYAACATYALGAGVALLSAGIASLTMTSRACVGETCEGIARGSL